MNRIADELQFKGMINDKTVCEIAPVKEKYSGKSLYDIIQEPRIVISKHNITIIKATFEDQTRGIKVYTVPNKKKADQILISESKFQHILINNDKVVKLYEAVALESPFGYAVALFMDFYEHGSYAHEIRRRAHHKLRFNEQEILTIFKRLVDILYTCEKNNIFHRDIKPDNILVNKNGLPELMEFGEAIQQDPKQPSPLAGTEEYMSFTLKQAHEDYTNRRINATTPIDHDLEYSDVMSLARTIISLCLLREEDILNDQNTYQDTQDVIWAQLSNHYSSALVRLIQSMMAFKEEDRPIFSTCQYELRELCKLQTGSSSGLLQIFIAPEIALSEIEEVDDVVSVTFGRSNHRDPSMPDYNTREEENRRQNELLAELLPEMIINGSMETVFDSDTDEEPTEEEKADFNN